MQNIYQTLFAAKQKIFIVRALGRNPSPAQVRKEFLLYFKIASRDATKLHARFFSRVSSTFE